MKVFLDFSSWGLPNPGLGMASNLLAMASNYEGTRIQPVYKPALRLNKSRQWPVMQATCFSLAMSTSWEFGIHAKKLLGTSASLLVTSALLVVTRSY